MLMAKFKIFVLSFLMFFIFLSSCHAYYEAPVDITKMDIYDIQEAIDQGYLTYELLIRLYLDRIEEYDDYNAIISINENAIEDAKECDREYKEKGRNSVLFCIPIIVKDNIDVKGMATTAGAYSLSDSIPNEDANVISKLKDRGMIVLAKTNMSEFAFMASSSVSSYGTVKNAYNLNYSSYGSSGGSAVGVSVNFAPVALGTDTNSSLRAPASANGVISFRSTFGLVDTTGILAYDIARDVVGPLTRSVKENALLLEVMAGKEEGVYSDLSSDSLKNKTIAVLDQFAYGDDDLEISGTGPTDEKIENMFNEALDKMEEAGAKIIHLDDFYTDEYYNLDQNTLGGWTMCYAFNKYIKNTSSEIKSFEELVYSSGHIYSLIDYLPDCLRDISEINEDENLKEGYSQYVQSIMEKYDVDAFVYPTTKNKVAKVDADEFSSASYAIAPILGYPAVSMPMGYDSDGLAYGMEFVGVKNDEANLYQIIYAFEQINKVYKLPDIAPSLYEVSSEVIKLKELYEKINEKTLFLSNGKNKVYEEIKDFFLNYNDYDNKAETATILYNKYKTADDLVLSANNLIYLVAGLVMVLLLGRLFFIKIRKNRIQK